MAKKAKTQVRMSRILAAAFPGLKIVEATVPLTLFPTQDDFDKGVPHDPQHCGFANTAARICGSTAAHFFSRYVYIDRVDDDGERKVFRYVTGLKIYKVLASFDKRQKVAVRRSFVLMPPSKSNTLEAHRRYNKSFRKGNTFKAIQAEKKAVAELTRAERELEQAKSIKSQLDFPAGSTRAKAATQRIEAAKAQVMQARAKADEAIKRAKEVRYDKFRTAPAKPPRKYDVHVRSGTGAWMAGKTAAATK